MIFGSSGWCLQISEEVIVWRFVWRNSRWRCRCFKFRARETGDVGILAPEAEEDQMIRWSADDRFIQGQWPWYTWSVAAGSANSSCHGWRGPNSAAWDWSGLCRQWWRNTLIHCSSAGPCWNGLIKSSLMLDWTMTKLQPQLEQRSCVSQARRAMFEVVHLLLKTGVDFDKAFISGGATPLDIATQNSNFQVARLLLEAGGDYDKALATEGETRLHMAAGKGHLEAVRFSIESGVDRNSADANHGATPLYMAAQNGHCEVVRFLLETGVDCDTALSTTGATPLHSAAEKSHLGVPRLVLEAQADYDTALTTWRLAAGHSLRPRLLIFSMHTDSKKGTVGSLIIKSRMFSLLQKTSLPNWLQHCGFCMNQSIYLRPHQKHLEISDI